MNKKEVLITKSSINFTFNCSWFSDTNGAVKYFTVVVREADGKCHDLIPFSLWLVQVTCEGTLPSLHGRVTSHIAAEFHRSFGLPSLES